MINLIFQSLIYLVFWSINTDTITITQPEEIIFSISVSDYNGYEISCLGQNDGQINFSPATGGLGPISYSIDANNFAQTLSYNNLSAGNYNIVVVDSVCYEL